MIKKETVLTGLVVAAVIDIMVFLFMKVTIAQSWPAYFTALLFMMGLHLIGSPMYSKIKDIFIGGSVGILLNFGQGNMITFLESKIGTVAAVLIIVGLVCFVMCIGGDVIPSVFNNYTFIYWSLAGAFGAVNSKPIGVLTLLGTLWLGGSIFIGLMIAFLRLGNLIPNPIRKSQCTNRKKKEVE